jgi:hypothetical protein
MTVMDHKCNEQGKELNTGKELNIQRDWSVVAGLREQTIELM